MLVLKITDLRDFMNRLLIGSDFDQFELAEASITTFCTFLIDGKLKEEFFDSDTCEILRQESLTCSLWKEIRPFCYSIIRGKRPPLHFRIVLQISGKRMASVFPDTKEDIPPEAVRAFFINLQYKNKELLFTTGYSPTSFLMDKTIEYLWDTVVRAFLQRQNILFEEM